MAKSAAWVNYAVCFSNISGALALCAARNLIQLGAACAAIGASALMHLSERKHGLPGVAPFASWSTAFLWADRLTAYCLAAYVAHCVLVGGMAVPWLPAVTGGLALLLSEHVEGGPLWFAATHSLWHICAYRILGLAFASL